MPRIVKIGLVTVISLLLGSIAGTQTAFAQTGTFEEAPCVFNVAESLLGGRETPPEVYGVRCGYLTVPVRHDNPDGDQIRLAVAIIPPQGETRPNDNTPLFLAQGGPGGSTIDLFGTFILENGLFEELGREIVLLEQRGTLHTEPNLFCLEEELALYDETLELELSDEEYDAREQAAYQACRDRLVADGIDLSAFNSVENAADFEALRAALGYEEFDFYGVSYGTLLGLHLLRDHPANLRTLILDAVVPMQQPFLGTVALTADRSFDELFATCAADPACAAAYPDLEERFYALVADLEANPTTITLTDAETGRVYETPFDGDAMIGSLFGSLYGSYILPSLPLMIAMAEQGNFDYLEADLSRRVFDRTFSSGMYNTVVCSEDFEVDPQILANDGVRPEVVANKQRALTSVLRACQDWEIMALDEVVNQPVVSDKPVLLMSGQFDPITPPANAAMAGENLSNSFDVTFPYTGHGAAFEHDCAVAIMGDFLNNPTVAPDTSCLADIEQPHFITPDEILLNTYPMQVNAGLERVLDGASSFNVFWQSNVMGLMVMFLLTSVFIVPVAFLIRILSSSETRPEIPGFLKVAGLWPMLTAILGFIFLVGLVVGVFYTFINVSDFAYFGMPLSFRPLFVLPWGILLLTVLMSISMVVAWVKGTWSIGWRIYYTLLTLAALLYTAAMVAWGALGVLL